TVFYNYSIVKGAATTIAHQLAERGRFTYDTPVAELWPEFGAHGKQAVTMRQVLNHTAGVPGIPLDTTVEDLCDWDRMCAAVADAELGWGPGTKTASPAYTWGYIVGEVVRRTTGKRISEVLREDVAGPLGVAEELYFGMPPSEPHRLAPLEDAPGAADMAASLPPDLPMFKSGPPQLFPNAAFGHRTDTCAHRDPCRSSRRRRRRCSPTPRSATAPTPSPLTSPRAARPPPGRSRACTPRCSARSPASGCCRPSGCGRRRPCRPAASTRSSACQPRGAWAGPSACWAPPRRTRRPRSASAASAGASPSATPLPGSRSRSPRTASTPTSTQRPGSARSSLEPHSDLWSPC